MAYKNLQEFIKHLEKESELIRVSEAVSPHLEAAEINDRIVKNHNKALLFENTGTPFPLLMNTMGSEKRMCMALGVSSLDAIGHNIESLFEKITAPQAGFRDKLRLLGELKTISQWLPKKLKKSGACQEVIMKEADLGQLPVITCWPHDGGPFITLPAVHTIDPETGITNVGMYRMQVYDKNATGMHWHLHKDSARHFRQYKEKKKRMPVSVSIGGDPVYSYVASAPLPENINEYILAGFLRQKKVELVKCITNDIYVPADADFILEGYIDTEEDFRLEGPFGDHTGFYSLADYYPVFHVTCITHRKDAVYPATVVGIPPQEDTWMGKATERIFLTPIRLSMLPEVVDMSLPAEGVFHNIAIVQIKNAFDGHAFKVMNALWGAGQMMLNKIMIVIDENVNISNHKEILHALINNIDVGKDILISKGPLDVLDHSTDTTGFGGKIGFSATTKDIKNNLSNFDKEKVSEKMNALEKSHTFIASYNKEFIEEGLPCLIIAINKVSPNELSALKKEILDSPDLKHIKYVLFIEHLIEADDYKDIVWRSANNIEPSRDCEISKNHCGLFVLFADATMKTLTYDAFQKDWPNIIFASEETIALVDEKWDKYKIGPFIESPSKKYALKKYSMGAIVSDKKES